MSRPPFRLRLVPPPRDPGPGLVRTNDRNASALDARLGGLMIEVGRLADEAQDDRELFTQLGAAAQALGLAQRHVRTRARK